MDILSVIVMGLIAGGASSLLGIGGGILFVPLLPIVSEIGYRETVATSLMTIFCISSLNSYFFHRKSLVDWKIVLILCPGTALGAYMGASMGYLFSDFYLRLVGVLCLVTLAGKTLWVGLSLKLLSHVGEPGEGSLSKISRKESVESVPLKNMDLKPLGEKNIFSNGPSHSVSFIHGQLYFLVKVFREYKVELLGGLLIGVLSGLTGIGTGVLLSSLLLNWGIVRNDQVSPTSNGIMIFTTFFGCLAFLNGFEINMMRVGEIHMEKVVVLFMSASVSAYFGRKYQSQLSAYWRGLILSCLLFFLSVYMVFTLVK